MPLVENVFSQRLTRQTIGRRRPAMGQTVPKSDAAKLGSDSLSSFHHAMGRAFDCLERLDEPRRKLSGAFPPALSPIRP